MSDPGINQTKNNRAPQSAKYSLRARRAHGGNRPLGTVPPLPALRLTPGTKLGAGRGYGKPIRQVGLHERPLAAGELRGCGRAFYSFLVDSGQRPESRGEFRILRDATQGSALRTRGLSRKAGESFH